MSVVDERETIEQLLPVEMLRIEKIRLGILSWITLLSVLINGAALLVSRETPTEILGITGTALRSQIILSVCMTALSLAFFLSWHRAGSLLRSRRPMPLWQHAANIIIETLIPTLVAFTLAGSIPHHQFTEFVLARIYPIYSVFIILSILRMKPVLSAATGFASMSSYAAIAAFLIGTDASTHILNAFYILLQGAFAVFIGLQLRNWLRAALTHADERNRIKTMFGQHVSPDVVERLLRETRGRISEKKHVAILFLDIRDFTSYSEKHSPEEVVAFLESVFGLVIEAVHRHGGMVNKFLGDGVMAVFGAPLENASASASALRASQEILQQIGSRFPPETPVRLGIGLHSGTVMVGHVGSDTRKEYTIIGDAVNTAARIESQNKAFGTQLLLSEEVLHESGGPAGAYRFMGEIQVKGKEKLIRVYSDPQTDA